MKTYNELVEELCKEKGLMPHSQYPLANYDFFKEVLQRYAEQSNSHKHSVSGALPLAECEKRERAAFVAGYRYMRERAEEMKKYPFDEAAGITANEEYWRWKSNDR